MYRSGITGVSLSDKDWTRTIGSGQSLELFMLQYYRGTHTHRERERERERGGDGDGEESIDGSGS
jgi:hypothetical protein